ncbi:MAG: substrate-binding domain-containing protein, partial [Flavobacteriaceae bacterium]|nr:substrate-binding domain-containing protein [Flavobacteriaceae bacterium]
IIGYSDWFVSSVIRPSLSTISQPVEELGKTAVKLLIDEIIHKIKNIKYNHQTIVIPTKFIKRSSS